MQLVIDHVINRELESAWLYLLSEHDRNELGVSIDRFLASYLRDQPS